MPQWRDNGQTRLLEAPLVPHGRRPSAAFVAQTATIVMSTKGSASKKRPSLRVVRTARSTSTPIRRATPSMHRRM